MVNHIKMLVVFVAVLTAGCMTEPGRNIRGDDANRPLTGSRLARSAYKALLDPQTYIPAAGAIVVATGGWDNKISDWASERTPVFGSQSAAKDASDGLLCFLAGETIITALATPSGNSSEQWAIDKAKVLGVEGAAFGVNSMATTLLKDATARDRPSGDGQCFPSGHSSGAFAAATLSNRNLEQANMPEGLRSSLQAGNIILAGGVAWARVESKAHYPTDVLAGASLGHFLSAWIYDAFLNQPKYKNVGLAILPYERGVAVSITIRY